MRRLVVVIAMAAFALPAIGQRVRDAAPGPRAGCSVLVGAVTDRTASVSVLSDTDARACVEYGSAPGELRATTAVMELRAGVPAVFELAGLAPDAEWFYRVNMLGTSQRGPGEALKFHTARKRGQGFTFCVQGDSHPERIGRMYDPDLYLRTLTNVKADHPDFYFLMGDDFSIERLFERDGLSQPAVDAVYAAQRGFLGIVGEATPLMLVNGNHEQAAKYLLDGTAHNGAVYAGKARTKFYPLPEPGSFYSGNRETVEHIGLLRDYYSWEWGDALFVVIDPYWHSSVVVDNEAGSKAPKRPGGGERGGKQQEEGAAEGRENRKGKGERDLWQVTLGDTQYQWLKTTLKQSGAKFKFVFCHHVLGTGRGGVEEAGRYEWGGQDGGGRKRERAGDEAGGRGLARFFKERPTWDMPIHALMKEYGVTIFFQGHDHLYAHQKLDGVVYQTCPNPADPTFTAFNKEAYLSGDVFPNSGHLRVSISGAGDGAECRVQYVRALRAGDEKDGLKNGSIVHEYVVRPRAAGGGAPPARGEAK